MTVDVRPLRPEHIAGAGAVVQAADDDAERRAGREPEPRTEEQLVQFNNGTQRFIDADPAGAWVALDGDRVVGMAEAIRRDHFWGLSMLFVDPTFQSQGVGRALIERTLDYAAGATDRMIMASPDPRALRRYARAGLRMHPTAEAEGQVDRSAIPAQLPGREGTADDLDLVATVDAQLLGRSRADDVAFALANGSHMEVVDHAGGRGFALIRSKHVQMLGATDDRTAAILLWRLLALTDDKATMYCLSAEQHWAIDVCFEARLKVKTAGALFVDGMDRPPGPWIPSGWYF